MYVFKMRIAPQGRIQINLMANALNVKPNNIA